MKTNLQALRKRAGFKSAAAFAEYAGISVGTYTDYEQGRISLSLERAWELADLLGCTLDELAGRDAIFAEPADRQERKAASRVETYSVIFNDDGTMTFSPANDGE